MSLKAMNSLDLVEALMSFEEIFGPDLPDTESEAFETSEEMLDWLEQHFSNRRPSKEAAKLLKKLAKKRNEPMLAEGVDGTWRREQIEAVVQEILRQ